jgi:hypothetical protein
MIDMSRNGVMKVEAVKKFIAYNAAMGNNMLMLYTEDTYKIPEYKYFGYMRGRYSESEIKEIDSRQQFLYMLGAIRAVDHQSGIEFSRQGYYILILNYNARRLSIKYFKPSQTEEANTTYTQIEGTRAESQTDAVLVRVSSFQTLRAAYPNYFSDIGEFIDILKGYIS